MKKLSKKVLRNRKRLKVNSELSKKEKINRIVSSDKIYSKIKFKNEIYCLNDYVLIRPPESSDKNYLIGKILSVIAFNGISKYSYWPSVEIQWCYTKYDINLKVNSGDDEDILDSLSDYEVFITNRIEIIFIENIFTKCSIVSYEEYEKIEKHSPTTFFTRANYNIFSKTVEPAIQTWEKFCSCQKPLNPDHLYIKCDKCQLWFHPKHCGLTDEEAEVLVEFICSSCKKSKK